MGIIASKITDDLILDQIDDENLDDEYTCEEEYLDTNYKYYGDEDDEDDEYITEDEVEIKEMVVGLTNDSIVNTIIEKFKCRSEMGYLKYGTNLDRTDLSVLDWINHAQEEHMDAILYLEKLKVEIKKRE